MRRADAAGDEYQWDEVYRSTLRYYAGLNLSGSVPLPQGHHNRNLSIYMIRLTVVTAILSQIHSIESAAQSRGHSLNLRVPASYLQLLQMEVRYLEASISEMRQSGELSTDRMDVFFAMLRWVRDRWSEGLAATLLMLDD